MDTSRRGPAGTQLTVGIFKPAIYPYFYNRADAVGGAERQLHLLATEFQKHLDVEVIVYDHGQPAVEVREGITLRKAHRPGESGSPLEQLTQVVRIARAIEASSADVILCRGSLQSPVVVGLVSRLTGKRFVYHVANDSDLLDRFDDSRWPTRRLFRETLAHADLLVTQTQRQKTLLSEKFGLESTIIPNGYPPTETHKDVPGEYFLWVGRLEEDQKQPHAFLDLADALPDEEFVLVGPPGIDSGYAEALQARIDRLENVRYTGPVAPEDIHAYYTRAIALVNTSKYEGFPNTFLEAWRQRTPVISLSVDPNRFLPDRHSRGFAADSMDRLRSLCEQFSADPDLERAEGEVGYDTFVDHYDIETVAERYLDELAAVVNSE